MNRIVEEVLNAVDEYTGSCTVIITNKNPEVPHGSGIAVQYGGQDYILTAAHVVSKELNNENIRVIGRPSGPLQMLRGKAELAEVIARGTYKPVFSSVTSINIMGRLSHDGDDIAVLKVENLKTQLPPTMVHNLSSQADAKISINEVVTIFGFPGELAKAYKHRTTGRRGLAAFPHITMQSIKDISEAPEAMNPNIGLITDFDYPEEQCDPRGMSGCGVWSIPGASKGELWSARKGQLLGILIGHYKASKLLRFVRIDRVVRLLTAGN
jgi:hypothetical protein